MTDRSISLDHGSHVSYIKAGGGEKGARGSSCVRLCKNSAAYSRKHASRAYMSMHIRRTYGG